MQHDFRKKMIERKMCFDFFYSFFLNISHSKNWTLHDQNCILVLMESNRYSCHMLMKVEFFRQTYEKYSDIKFD
jgi:hypothetical protein